MKIILLALLASFGLTLIACDPFPSGNNNPEKITRVYLNLHCTDSNSIDSLHGLWKDEDGPGGANPVLPDTLIFNHNKSYNVSLYFGSSDVKGNPYDLTSSIEALSYQHIICYEVNCASTSSSLIEITRLDKDKNNLEIGLKTLWKIPQNSDVGKIVVRLKHQPNVKNGSCDPGETDVQVEFPYRIH